VPSPFPRDLLNVQTLTAARQLLGARLVRHDRSGRRAGRIVEVEAYIGQDDLACHARFGRTGRNSVMFGPPGVAYVYLVYGMYDCLNVVTEPIDQPAAVLIRAVEPIEGIPAMRQARSDRIAGATKTWDEARRRRETNRVSNLPATALASGPGLVCAAFAITRADDGRDLCAFESPLRLERAPEAELDVPISSGPRVGIAYAAEPWRSKPWRLWISGNPAVPRRGGVRHLAGAVSEPDRL
jgi:DNA-3-methyladenine glycosylase